MPPLQILDFVLVGIMLISGILALILGTMMVGQATAFAPNYNKAVVAAARVAVFAVSLGLCTWLFSTGRQPRFYDILANDAEVKVEVRTVIITVETANRL